MSKKAVQYCRAAQKDDKHIAAQIRSTLAYAKKHGIKIVSPPFVDNGFCGLDAEHRPAFMEMIRLVESGKVDFDTILVSGIGRWGRFTNCNEAMYWEFICNKHGVQVVFTDDTFESFHPPANIGKALRKAIRLEIARQRRARILAGRKAKAG